MVQPDRISRFLSYILRHRPKEYPLVFDSRGFTDWRAVVDLVQQRYYEVTEEEIRAVVCDAKKQRFELSNDRVRASYGHSFPVDPGAPAEPPDLLYFGTARDLAQSMVRSGLKPRDRQFIHLSVSVEEAEAVARRHDPAPVVIAVYARRAHGDGIRFFPAGPLFLVESVPARYLEVR